MAASSDKSWKTFQDKLLKSQSSGGSIYPRGNQPIKLSVEEMRQYIGEMIGRGSFGRVYKANMHQKVKGNFIIKEIKITDKFTRTSYRNTIRFGNILHPFINPIIACAESLPTSSLNGISYLMYPYMRNRDLRFNIDYVNQGSSLSREESNSRKWTRCMHQIVQAVDFLHSPVKSTRGPIFHQDLTSRNIFLDENFNVRIGDFGIAVEARWNTTHATLTKALGTEGYHPPNMNPYEYNASYDVFSVGVVMLEILTGLEARIEEDPHYLYKKYNCDGGYEDLIEDLEERAIKNKAARWHNIFDRDKFVEMALLAVALDENQRKTIRLLQKLEDMQLEPSRRYRGPKNLDICVSCCVNPTAKLSTKGRVCLWNKLDNPCQYFCLVCLMNHHFNPLVCPEHGKTRPPFGDYVYGVFVAGNSVHMCPFQDVLCAQMFMRDIQKVVEVITAKHPFVLGVSDKNVRVVMPEKPGTEDAMEAKIKQAFEDINVAIKQAIQTENLDPEKERLPSSLFIFYFSGHCSKEGLYLGSTHETLEASTPWIQEMLHKKLGVDQIVVVLDCSHANSQNFTDTHGLNAVVNFKDGRKKAHIVQLSLCDVHETYRLESEYQISYFTNFFCKGLLGLDSVPWENDAVRFCDQCEIQREDRNVIDFTLPCGKYHYQCLIDRGVTIYAMKNFIQGHFQRLEEVIRGPEFRIQLHNAQGEKEVFLAYYNPQKQHMKYTGDIIPEEILQMGEKSIQLYKEALQNGMEKVYNIRVMVVGHQGVGKTTLTKRLRGQQFDASTESTDGIDVHQHCFKISLETHEWIVEQKGSDQFFPQKRLAKLIPDYTERSEVNDKQEEHIKGKASSEDFDGDIANNDNSVSATSGLDQNGDIPSTQLTEPVSVAVDYTHTTLEARSFPILDNETYGTSRSEKPDPTMELCQLVNPDEEIQWSTVEYAALSMWDFAVQSAFYTTHQTFLTWRAVYLLVTDLCQQITDFVEDDDHHLSVSSTTGRKFHKPVQTWLNSIHSCARPPTLKSPPVILVGTHADKIPEKDREKVIKKHFEEIHKILKDNPARHHIVAEIAIDNTLQSETEMKKLKEMIFKEAAKQTYWGEVRPARWLILEQAIMKLRDEGKKVVTFSDVEGLNEASSVKIETKELNLFLEFQHALGLILFFSEEGLKENIVLDPQWLIDAQKSLITAEQFMRRKPNYQKWCEFDTTGILTNELIDSIWTKEDYPEFHANKDHILLLMQRQGIIVKPKIYIESGEENKNEEYFLAPCMLKEKTPRDIICRKTGSEGESSSVFCCVFKEKFLPIPVFHKLLATCLANWPIATRRSKNLIFSNCCIFVLDKFHRLTLYFREHIIFAHVTRIGDKDLCQFSKICSEAKTYIVKNLEKIISKMGQSLQFHPYIRCPKFDSDSLDGLFAVSCLEEEEKLPCYDHAEDHMIVSQELLQFWFVKDKEDCQQKQQEIKGRKSSGSEEDQEESEDDADAPITQEHINYARLCNVLMTVCADAMREILINHVPANYSSLNQAILAKKGKLNSKGKGQKGLLNKHQCSLVFPDPQYQCTGTVDKFDISLLYVLIRNVSAVQQPTTGWEKDPTDSPRDDSLGASVERIRSCRNGVGHSVDGKLSDQEFEGYWSKIENILHDIENMLGDKGYQLALETRRNQAITPCEARQLMKKFQEYKKQVEVSKAVIKSAVETIQLELDNI